MERAQAHLERLSTGGLRIVASTDRRDRDGRIVHQDGWELDDFRANPVLMFNHEYMDHGGRKLPVGRVGRVDVVDGKLIAEDITWAKDEFAQMVKEMYEPSDGSPPIMQAVSVGWLPLVPPEDRDDGQHHVRQSLVELSTTPIPSNADANALIAAALSRTPPPAVLPNSDSSDGSSVTDTADDAEGGEGDSPADASPVSEPVSPEPPEANVANTTDVTYGVKSGQFVLPLNESGLDALSEAVRLATTRRPDEALRSYGSREAALAAIDRVYPTEESPDEPEHDGSAPEKASGLTPQERAERVATVAAKAAEQAVRQLAGRL